MFDKSYLPRNGMVAYRLVPEMLQHFQGGHNTMSQYGQTAELFSLFFPQVVQADAQSCKDCNLLTSSFALHLILVLQLLVELAPSIDA